MVVLATLEAAEAPIHSDIADRTVRTGRQAAKTSEDNGDGDGDGDGGAVAH